MLRLIKHLVDARYIPEGVGAHVYRSIGTRTLQMFNPFLACDHIVQSPSSKGAFPEHPHAGMETITYMLSGGMAHEDFTGSRGLLFPGDLQFMTAGRGIVHAEIPINIDNQPVTGIQLWVDLPADLKDIDPAYRDLKAWEYPTVSSDDGQVQVKIISGRAMGIDNRRPLVKIPLDYYHYTVKPQATFSQSVEPDWSYFLYNFSDGTIEVDSQKIKPHTNAFFNDNGDVITGTNRGTKPAEFVLVGGPKLNQKVLHHGTFIGTSNKYITDKIADYQNQDNAFAPLHHWRSAFSDGGVPAQFVADQVAARRRLRASVLQTTTGDS